MKYSHIATALAALCAIIAVVLVNVIIDSNLPPPNGEMYFFFGGHGRVHCVDDESIQSFYDDEFVSNEMEARIMATTFHCDVMMDISVFELPFVP